MFSYLNANGTILLAENNTLTECRILNQSYDVATDTLTLSLCGAKGETFERAYTKPEDIKCFYYNVDHYKAGRCVPTNPTRDTYCVVLAYYGRASLRVSYKSETSMVATAYHMGESGVCEIALEVSKIVREEDGILYATLAEQETKIYENREKCVGYERHILRREDGTETEEGGYYADCLFTDEQKAAVDAAIAAIRKAQELGINVCIDRSNDSIDFIGGGTKYDVNVSEWAEDVVCDFQWNEGKSYLSYKDGIFGYNADDSTLVCTKRN